jgi:hypothetical protein
MVKATHLQEFGNLRAVLFSDGRKVLMLPTGSNLWISTNPPYPEIAYPPLQKTVVSNDFITSIGEVRFAVRLGSRIVIGMHHGGTVAIYYTDNGGLSWTLTPDSTQANGPFFWSWAQVANGRIFVGARPVVISDNGEQFDIIDTTPLVPGWSGGGWPSARGVVSNGSSYRMLMEDNGGSVNNRFVGLSSDGINFTFFPRVMLHTDGTEHIGDDWGGSGPSGIEIAANGRYIMSFGAHLHGVDGADVTYFDGWFDSGDGITWTEHLIDEVEPPEILGPPWYPVALAGKVIGQLFKAPPFQLIMSTPSAITGGRFARWTNLNWDDEIAEQAAIGTNYPIMGEGNQWLTYALGRWWAGYNYTGAQQSELMGTSFISPYIPMPGVFGEDGWRITAKVADADGNLIVFERRYDGTHHRVSRIESV